MKTVKIKLDIEREIKMGSKAFVMMERLAGKPMDKINFESQESVFIMLGAGLSHAIKNVTLDKVYDIVDKAVEKVVEEEKIPFMDAYGKVLETIGKAMEEALPNG